MCGTTTDTRCMLQCKQPQQFPMPYAITTCCKKRICMQEFSEYGRNNFILAPCFYCRSDNYDVTLSIGWKFILLRNSAAKTITERTPLFRRH